MNGLPASAFSWGTVTGLIPLRVNLWQQGEVTVQPANVLCDPSTLAVDQIVRVELATLGRGIVPIIHGIRGGAVS